MITYLVGFYRGYLLVDRNGVADFLLPRLERALRNGLSHLRHLDGFICPKASTPNTMLVHDSPRPATQNKTKDTGPNSARTL